MGLPIMGGKPAKFANMTCSELVHWATNFWNHLNSSEQKWLGDHLVTCQTCRELSSKVTHH